ncbi:hypothetical protein B0J13DRAFT_519052 [Dactylonectria estremocensis]|uniref:DUF1993 domain-containing protein n=1 Tax=Dactylonectria estremocensis TaxID=1079267 RepID=A0A9P9JFM1_9HYPO|nr:hypothetical protein B0J13DRAFT_519052 [Dactylonectria estremocensis]
MSYSLYDASIVQAQDGLNALKAIIAKAEAHTDNASLAGAKLIDDMLPFSFQVSMATDVAQKLAARGTGTEPLNLDRNFENFAAMQARCDQVLEILSKVDRDTFNGRQDVEVTIGLGPGKEATVQLKQYVAGYVLPNLYFHITTAYAVLRKEGVDIGKQTYLTPFMGKYLS